MKKVGDIVYRTGIQSVDEGKSIEKRKVAEFQVKLKGCKPN
jgi:hypothetical protein